NDSLVGNGGRDFLVGGSGADVLQGLAGDDILLGDALIATYYNETTGAVNVTALKAIMKEWTSTTAYATRVSHLLNSGGFNGTTKLNKSKVVHDGVKDTLTGGLGSDWFLVAGTLTTKDKTDKISTEILTLV